MQITSKQIYFTIITGAHTVIKNKEILNEINVFPIRDGDTGNNLASTMRAIIQNAESKDTIKKTLESIADAALYGARGNSGIIFAQYLSGLSESVDDTISISILDYAKASNQASRYTYNSVEEPVEGTILTVMREWGNALTEETKKTNVLIDIFSNAYSKIEIALEKTKNQLDVIRKANVVDSGAKGFTYFVEGALYYIKNGGEIKLEDIEKNEHISFDDDLNENYVYDSEYRYCTECLLGANDAYVNDYDIDINEIKSFLKHKGNSLVVAGNKKKCRIHIHTNEPAAIFEYLHDKGTIFYQKVDDMFKQEAVLNNQKSKIAIVTDSIADLPQDFIDKHQIHVVNIDILYKDYIYMDKLTIHPHKLLELSKSLDKLPTSSQPSLKKIEKLYDYLSEYYDSAIVLTVSKELSGTFNAFNKVAQKYDESKLKINIINTKQNSGAEGLLVVKCAEFVELGMNVESIIADINDIVKGSKILVEVQTLDHMIKSGRLNVKVAKIAKKMKVKPVVSLDSCGKGVLEGIAFSEQGSRRKILKHICKVLKHDKIMAYCIVHVNDCWSAEKLVEDAEQLIGFPPMYVEEASSIIAIGAGQGAVALSYVLEKEEDKCI